MAMNPNAAMAGMNPMGGNVVGVPVPMMNNGTMNPQAAAAANAAAARQQQLNENQRGVLNTYIYDYFIRYGMFDCARSLLSSDQQVNVIKDGVKNGANGVGDDAMDTDSKDDIDSKLPEDLPPPKLPMAASDTSFLHEWFYLFWDIYTAQRVKGGNGTVNQYVAHTQQQEQLLRQMRPDLAAQQQFNQMQLMRNMQNGMALKQNNLARAAMANNQNPTMMMGQKQNPMQRDPSGLDPNRDRPASPASGDNAPSPNAKRPRLDSQPFVGNQPGAMMPNGQAGNPPNMATVHQMLSANGINPSSLTAQQLHNFANTPPAARMKSIQTYSQNLSQQQNNQMGNKPMPNVGGPQNQGSPMVPSAPDGAALNAFYNANEMGGPAGMRPGPGGAQTASGSNHALQDYQMQLMLLEQQNKKRLMMARQEQDNMGGAQPGGPGAGPNGQPFPDASPQAVRSGTSPNPTDQAKRGTSQMNSSGIPSPVPEGGQSRDSPNPAMNFMGNHVDPNMAPHFFKGMDGQNQMNGMRPPSSHPGQPFNQQQMMARQGQAGAQGNPQQWQQGPNGQAAPQGVQPGQGTPQQRAMPPPSAPATGGNANTRATASPQQSTAAPPTPNQTTKTTKKKETKAQKDKRAAANAKKNQASANASATPAADVNDQETPTPATPMTPASQAFKNGAAATGNSNVAAPAASAAPSAAGIAGDQGGLNNMDGFGDMGFVGNMDLNNPLQSGDVLNDFDFDSFLHDGDGTNDGGFDFNAFGAMEGNELSTE